MAASKSAKKTDEHICRSAVRETFTTFGVSLNRPRVSPFGIRLSLQQKRYHSKYENFNLIIVAFATTLLAASAAASDRLELTDGRILTGKYQGGTPTVVRMQ